MTTCVSKATAALVVIDQLDAVEAAVTVAGPRLAFIEIPLTVVTSESWRAGTPVTAHTIFTLSSILTERLQRARLGGTVIHVHFTLESMRSTWASTLKVVNKVDACSSISAGLRLAFINIILAVHPLVAGFTYTFICALIILACSTIATRV